MGQQLAEARVLAELLGHPVSTEFVDVFTRKLGQLVHKTLMAERQAIVNTFMQMRADDGDGQHQQFYATFDACINAVIDRGLK